MALHVRLAQACGVGDEAAAMPDTLIAFDVRYAIREDDVILCTLPTFAEAATVAAGMAEEAPWAWHDARPLIVGRYVVDTFGVRFESMCRVTRRRRGDGWAR